MAWMTAAQQRRKSQWRATAAAAKPDEKPWEAATPGWARGPGYETVDGGWFGDRDKDPRRKPWPDRPPANFYDPVLDMQQGQAERGYADLLWDAGIAGQRQGTDFKTALGRIDLQRDRLFNDSDSDFGRRRSRLDEDYETGKGRVETQYGRSLADLLTDRTRFGEDWTKQRTRGTEDYQRNVSGLERQYGRLAGQQQQRAVAQGASRGGALAQALRKRQENQAWDRQPLDTSYNRFIADSDTTKKRYDFDSGLREERLGEDKKATLADLLRDYTRGGEDLTTAERRAREDLDARQGDLGLLDERTRQDRELELARAGRELGHTQADMDTVRWAQAQQAGYQGPTPKAGFQAVQRTGPNAGLSYRTATIRGKRYKVYEDGRRVPV